jgi:hypothetical protein
MMEGEPIRQESRKTSSIKRSSSIPSLKRQEEKGSPGKEDEQAEKERNAAARSPADSDNPPAKDVRDTEKGVETDEEDKK